MVSTMNVAAVAGPSAQIEIRTQAAQPQPAQRAVDSSAAGSGNLSQQAASTYEILRGGAGFPPSAEPTFVLPTNSRGFEQLYNALQAVAVEHVYPAPIFSFTA
jgi:hypothetical protein